MPLRTFLVRGSAFLRSLAILTVAFVVWLPCVQLFFRVPEAKREKVTEGLLARQNAAWKARPEDRADLRNMRGVNPEWDFMARTFTALALADRALAHHGDPDAERTLATLVDDTRTADATLPGDHFFLKYVHRAPFMDTDVGVEPEAQGRGIFIDGELLAMMAAEALAVPATKGAAFLQEGDKRAARIEASMRKSPSLSGESYPNECWTFCNTTALMALRLWDIVRGTDHSPLARAWISYAKSHLMEPRTGLLVSSFRYDGTPLDGPEGSTLWMSAQNLRFIDEGFARDQYTRARKEIGQTFLGFGWAREWPRSLPDRPDVDSGLVVPVLNASPGSSGLALLGAAAFDDGTFRDGLLASLELAAFPKETPEGRTYRAGNAMGDAVLLRALTFGPLLKIATEGPRP